MTTRPPRSPAAKAWSWPLSKLRRRLWHATCRRLYRDDDRDPGHTLLIAGTARSGTTWLADVLAAQRPARVLFEPFHPYKVDAYRDFHYFQYLRPADEAPALTAYCQRLFTGRIRDGWIDRQVAHLRPEGRIIKEIRANLMLKWLHVHFPQVPMLFITRHPCAVVLSRLQLDWDTDEDIDSFLAQEQLVADHLADVLDVIERARTPEEKHAVIWCVSHRVPLRQFAPGELPLVFYEELCVRPLHELERLGRALGQSFSRAAPLDRPSQTATRHSAIVRGEDRIAAWRRKLQPDQVGRILRVVEAFGLDSLYGEDPLPRAMERESP